MNNLPAEKVKRDLPSLDDLYNDVVLAKQKNDLNKLLNQEPRQSWIEQHPIAKKKVDGKEVPCEYVTVQRMEYLLTSIFLHWSLEIKEVKVLGNSVCAIVRLHYQSPLTGEMLFQDGVGAVAIQMDKNSAPNDISKIKSNAIQIGAPAAETYAFKDAAEKIGKIFGKDLNRADKIFYDNLDKKLIDKPNEKGGEVEKGIVDRITDEKEKNRIINHINNSKTLKELREVELYIKRHDLTEDYLKKVNEIADNFLPTINK